MKARTALVERRNQEFPKWNVYERESFWISIIVWNAFHPSQTLAVPDRYPRPNGVDIEMLIQFGDVDLSVDPLTEATVIDMYLRNDLITRADVIASNRRVPIQRATEILKQIQEQNQKDKPEPTSLLKETTPRIGQNGNRPMVNERDRSKTGGNTTSGTGNITIGGN